MHYEDETHLDTNPSLSRVWHRVGTQPTVPAAGTNRRLTVFGSVEALGRGRIEVLGVRQDSAGFARYLAALEARHHATGRQIILVLDNGSCHVSKVTRARTGRARGVAGGHPPGALQPAPQPQGARVADPQARPSRPSGRLLARVRGHGGGGLGRAGRGAVRGHRRRAPMVAGRAPQGTDRTPAGATHGRQGRPSPQAAGKELTSRYLGTLVICTGFRNPALPAKMTDTVEVISNGRLILGIGAG